MQQHIVGKALRRDDKLHTRHLQVADAVPTEGEASLWLAGRGRYVLPLSAHDKRILGPVAVDVLQEVGEVVVALFVVADDAAVVVGMEDAQTVASGRSHPKS